MALVRQLLMLRAGGSYWETSDSGALGQERALNFQFSRRKSGRSNLRIPPRRPCAQSIGSGMVRHD